MERNRKPTIMQAQVSLPRRIAITLGIMIILFLFVYYSKIPNPNMILIAGLVFCSAMFGYSGGIVASAFMICYSLFFFSTDHSFTQFTPENLQKVVVTLLGVLVDMLFVCQLKREEILAFQEVNELTEKLHKENERLQYISLTDALTGIRNRMGLRKDYESYENHEVTVLMIDLNDFKNINDTYGHDEGDRILRETGKLLADIFGEDHSYRYGGDEFLVIVPDISETEFQEKLNTMMGKRPSIMINGEPVTVGYSTGYVHELLTDSSRLRNLMLNADERMYQTKRDQKSHGRLHSKNNMSDVSENRKDYTVEEMREFLANMSEDFDLARMVDPIEGRVLEIQDDGTIKRDKRCYGIWKADQKCLNCSSTAACRTGCHHAKNEFFEDQVYHIQSNPVSLKLPDGSAYNAVVELVNIKKDSDTKNANDRTAENVGNRAAYYQAFHDSLTKVLNAGAFYELSREMIIKNPETSWVMITGNIMHFHLINNLFDVMKGNEVLVRTAYMLQEIAVDAKGLCGRLGGDQFALLLPQESFREDSLQQVADTLADIYSNGIFTFCIHFGIYLIGDRDIPVSVMCGRANSALHTIRESRVQSVAYFNDSILVKLLHEQRVIGGFEEALNEGQFKMYLQPLVGKDGNLIGAEALARWCKPDGTVIMPGDFIETLETAGLIQKLDMYIWELAVRQLSIWKGTDKENLTISVNMSAKDFYSIDVYDVLVHLLDRYNVDSSRLRLEITETALLIEPEKSEAVVSRLREKGFLVEIDDFGKGYSSLSLLKNIHADVLKIDMGFLQEIHDSKRNEIILESVIAMARSLNMDVITEGVETEKQFRTLSNMGCTCFQGYYFSRPVPVDEFEMRFI